jgi:hypothetical protein
MAESTGREHDEIDRFQAFATRSRVAVRSPQRDRQR